MPIIKIDDQDYEFDTLPDPVKAQLQSLQFVDAELQRLQAQAAVLQTARAAYAKALKEAQSAAYRWQGRRRISVPPCLPRSGFCFWRSTWQVQQTPHTPSRGLWIRLQFSD